ncbi:MAG: hypothetical protein IPM24_07585 [Bryobacterales bacterium]|nr:hypothetical protein [Bryobacterales bacterium]
MTSVTVDGRLVFLVAIDTRFHRRRTVHAEHVGAGDFAMTGRAGHLRMARVAEEDKVRHAVEALRRRLRKIRRQSGREDPGMARPALSELGKTRAFSPLRGAVAVRAGKLLFRVDAVAEPLGVKS